MLVLQKCILQNLRSIKMLLLRQIWPKSADLNDKKSMLRDGNYYIPAMIFNLRDARSLVDIHFVVSESAVFRAEIMTDEKMPAQLSPQAHTPNEAIEYI
jgi:hypothetical protein